MVGIFVVATTAATWAAYSYSHAAVLNGAVAEQPVHPAQPASNTMTKGDRLTITAPAVTFDHAAAEPRAAAAPSGYSVAAFAATAVEPAKPRTEPRIETRRPASSPEKLKRAEQQKLLLDDAQIASLRTRLKLSPTQEEFWPAVEITLRDVIRQHARNSRKSNSHGGTAQIDVNSAEVQQLISAAVPLIMRLSEEQKREVRALARIIGLETVASRI
jgi:hypothetical protein